MWHVSVDKAITALAYGFEVFIDSVNAARGVHPTGAVVEALIDEKLTPRDRAIGVESFVARHLKLGAEEEGSVRVDQQKRMMRNSVRRRDSDAVRTARFCKLIVVCGCEPSKRWFAAIESREIIQVDAFNVTADAAFGEGESHPGLEVLDEARFHFVLFRKIEVHCVGEGIHNRLQPRRACVELALECVRVDEQFHPQILENPGFAFGFRQSTHGVQVVCFDAIEVVFSLGVDHPEDGVGICFAMNMRDAPIVASDGDALSLLLPTC